MMTMILVTSLLVFFPLLSYIALATFTIVLTLITWFRQQLKSDGNSTITALYCGRVSHTRFQPIIHSFSYPLFFCLVDLSEVKDLFYNKWSKLWPLSFLMTFKDEDHLKNGEGLISSSDDENDNSLSRRIRRLVSERTNGKCNPTPEQKILILTHLSYFGYCFNPVSFYYILKENKLGACEEEESIEAIVAEVSNTPWNEMRCYVLHPDSCDIQLVKKGRSRKINENDEVNNDWKSINYIFEKKFHVSPFMEMNYIYDWTFWQFKIDRIIVNTLMIKQHREETKETDLNGKSFSAFFDIRRSSFSPFSLCYQLLKFPVYCFIIQVWIHYEALKLFVKGVEFIPHPEGSETRASAIIGAIMEPFFGLKDWLSRKRENKDELKKQKSE